MDSSDLVWGALLGAGVLFEGYALFSAKQGDTLSERTRVWARVHTKGGKALFVGLWVGFAAWFTGHIVGWWW